MALEHFRSSLRAACRASHHTQRDLAQAIGVPPSVLSLKINGADNARFTDVEIQRIVLTLTRWQALTTYDDVKNLLATLDLAPTIIPPENWQREPLNLLREASASIAVPPTAPAAQACIGRDSELQTILDWVASGTGRVLTVTGQRGSGKTTLVKSLAYRSDLPLPVTAVLSVGDSTDSTLVALRMLVQLGKQTHCQDAAIATVAVALAFCPAGIVLIDCADVRGLSSLMDVLLAHCPHQRFVVASQTSGRFTGERVMRLNGLAHTGDARHLSDAARLLQSASAAQADGIDMSVLLLNQLGRHLQGHPLALHLAGRLSLKMSYSHMLQALHMQRPATIGEAPLAIVPIPLNEILTLIATYLSDSARFIWATLAIHPDGVTVDTLRSLTKGEEAALCVALADLVSLGLVTVEDDLVLPAFGAEATLPFAMMLLSASERDRIKRDLAAHAGPLENMGISQPDPVLADKLAASYVLAREGQLHASFALLHDGLMMARASGNLLTLGRVLHALARTLLLEKRYGEALLMLDCVDRLDGDLNIHIPDAGERAMMQAEIALNLPESTRMSAKYLSRQQAITEYWHLADEIARSFEAALE